MGPGTKMGYRESYGSDGSKPSVFKHAISAASFPQQIPPLIQLDFPSGLWYCTLFVNYLCLEQIIAVRSQKQNTNGCAFVIHLILPFLLFGTNFGFYLHFTFLQQYQNKINKSFTVCFGKINSH